MAPAAGLVAAAARCEARRSVNRQTARIVAALTAARWPTGQRVIDIDELVLVELVVPHLQPVLRAPRRVRDRAKRSDRRRP